MNVISEQPPALVLFDVATGQPLMRLAQDNAIRQISLNFSPDGRHAIFGRNDGTVSVLDLVEVNRRLTGLQLGW